MKKIVLRAALAWPRSAIKCGQNLVCHILSLLAENLEQMKTKIQQNVCTIQSILLHAMHK